MALGAEVITIRVVFWNFWFLVALSLVTAGTVLTVAYLFVNKITQKVVGGFS